MRSTSRFLPTGVGYLQDARSVAGRRLSDALSACRDSDAIIASDAATIVGWQVAEHFGRPLVRVRLNLPASARSISAPVRRALGLAAWRAARVWLDRVRRGLGLPALPAIDPIRSLDASHAPELRAYSPAVGGLPPRGRDWVNVTGYWFLDRRLDPEPGSVLREFLAAGPPPVCFDFGSMLDADPDATTELVVDVLGRAGRRGVLIRGRYRNSDIPLPGTVLAIDAVPHDWLLRRCSAVVHHAGAGTGAAALAAGTPSVTVPHTAEQHRWAQRMHAIGVATAPIPRRRMSVRDLHGAVAAATRDPALSARTAMVGATVRGEDGVANALRALEDHLDMGTEAIGPRSVCAR